MLFRLMCLLHGHVTGDIPVLASPHGGWRGPPHSSLQRPRERVEAAVGSWGVDERSGSGAQHAPPQGHRAVWIYFFAMNVYFPLSSDSLTKSVDELDPDRRSTAEERRRVIVAALQLSSRMAEDPELPPSARTAALVQIKVLSDQLMKVDADDPETVADAWSGKRPRAI